MIIDEDSVILIIELGLNIITQDLVFSNHTEKDIEDYVDEFKWKKEK